jgi:hypothetical protein
MHKSDYSCMYSYFIALITNLSSQSFFYYYVPVRCMWCKSPMAAARNRGGEGTIISEHVIDINKRIY